MGPILHGKALKASVAARRPTFTAATAAFQAKPGAGNFSRLRSAYKATYKAPGSSSSYLASKLQGQNVPAASQLSPAAYGKMRPGARSQAIGRNLALIRKKK